MNYTDRYSPGSSLAYLVEMGYVEMGTKGSTGRGPPESDAKAQPDVGRHIQSPSAQATPGDKNAKGVP